MKVRPLGDVALLVEVDGFRAAWALAAATRSVDGVLDVVPAAETVLVTARPGVDLIALARTVSALSTVAAAAVPDAPDVQIAVCYDGPDLAEVAAMTGLDREAVVAAHTGTPWRVAFGGFAPGFAYLGGGDERLRVARRDEPRTDVPAGSVGLAGGFSGVYPRSMPGGWQLIGRTDAVLWDAARDPPALLRPGARVHFVRAPPPSVDAGPRVAVRTRSRTATEGARGAGAAEILTTGPLSLVQDLGRPGHADVGVPRSGAADRGALRLANRLVANDEGAAGIEVLLGGLAVRALVPLTVALAGAAAPADVDGTPVGHHAVLALRADETLTLGAPSAELRTYLAFRGGVDVAPTLGSRSTDTLSGLGPRPLQAGDVLSVGRPADSWPLVDVAPVASPPDGAVELRAFPGPQLDWLDDPAVLATTDWTASSRSNRVGLRLDGTALPRRAGEVPSAGVVRGVVQVPPGGGPVVLLADHPVTGGYPVAAVVLDRDVDRAAQIRPGQSVRFRLCTASAW